MADVADKLVYFQAITGLEDPDLCTEILSAHGWDLEQAISSFTSTHDLRPPTTNADAPSASSSAPAATSNSNAEEAGLVLPASATGTGEAPGLAWKIVTLPFSIISSSLGLVSGAVGLGMWAASGVLSYSLGMIGLNSGRVGDSSTTAPLVPVSVAASEAMEFVSRFERDFGRTRPNFEAEGFMDALQRSGHAFKPLFVYLHSPDHPDTPVFCDRTLCNEALLAFINENFVAWGGSIRASEGFKMSNSLKAAKFPFCSVVMAATNQRIALLQQIEGPKSPEEMINILQRVLEESAPVLVAARLDAEERRNNMRLREEQDAAYSAALEADQARERQRREEQERLEREAAEAERKRKEEEEALERAAREAAEKEAALAKSRQEKALSLGAEPEKGADVTQEIVVVKPMEEIVVSNGSTTSCSKPSSSLERKVRPQKEQALNCPRCNSTNTKFCYYNNYNLSQPRYFCKTCRRYWTEGGSLRNIPVGGGSRKNKRSSSSASSTPTSVPSSKKLPDLIPPSSHSNPEIHEGQDLNLGFSASHDFKTITELIQVPNFESNNKDNNFSCSNSTTSCHRSALELLTGITPIRELNSFMPMPITTDPTVVYSSSGGFQLPEFKPSLSFSLDGLENSGGYGSLHGVQESSGGRFLFPFEDVKQVSSTTSTAVDQQNRDQHADSTGYWTGVLGGGGGSW